MRGTAKLGLALRSLVLVAAVSLLAAAKPPAAKAAERQHAAEATYIGFNVGTSGAGMVFVQLTEVVPVEVSQSQGAVTFLLKGARVRKKNNFNPLPAAAFGSALARAQLLPDKAGIRLVLSLTAPVKVSHRVVRQGRGAVLEVDIPAPARTGQ